MSDIIAVFTWWVLVQIFGLVSLPIAFRLFWRLPDRGYGISKALGLLVPSYLFWLLGVLGFLRNDSGSILLSLVIIAIAAQLFYRRPQHSGSRMPDRGSRTTLSSWLRANWKLVLIIELVFAVSFAGWALYRAYVPRIMTAGGEKFMELAFLNGIERSATMPPLDPWLSGFAISYYYFGYVMMSNLIRLSGVSSSVGFNIGGALLFALTVTGAFSLVFNLVASLGARRRNAAAHMSEPLTTGSEPDPPTAPPENRPIRKSWVWIAVLGTVFVVLLSNFEGPLEVAHWNGLGSEGIWKWLDIADLDRPPPTQQVDQANTRLTRPGWWWWRASRVIFDYDVRDWPNRSNKAAEPPPQRRENIDEFPFFSFLLGDMHPHVLALPFVMLAMTVSLALFHTGFATRQVFHSRALKIPGTPRSHLFLWALIFGALGFLNTWDFPMQWAVAVGAYTLGRLGSNRHDLRPHLRSIATLAATLAIGGLLLYAPFYVGFQSQAGGPLVHVHSSTRLPHFVVMFGPLLFILISFLAWGVRRAWRERALELRTGLWTATILLLLALGMFLITALVVVLSPMVRELVAPGLLGEEPSNIARRYLNMRLSTPWVTLLLVGMISTAVALLRYQGLGRVARFSTLLIIAGAAMTLVPDYVYLKDVFGVRLNTIFKFYYQAWVLWAVAAAGAVYALWVDEDSLRSAPRWLFGAGLALVIGLGLVYPALAIPDRVKEFPEAPTLDGTAYLAREEAADYAAVQWLNTHVEGAPVILEAPGGAYQYESRVSAQTGLPTLLGWAGHEHQWRGNTVEQSKRLPVFEELCSTTDAQRTLTLLNEYDISYVYVGALERTKCPAAGLQKFSRLMETVYDRDGVTIYRRRDALGSRIGE